MNQAIKSSTSGSSLADILERVLDKGIVIAGDITVSVGSVELLSIRIRLLVASVDKAKEIGINWWESDPYLSTKAQELTYANQKLLEKVNALEQELTVMKSAQPLDLA
ncbi:MAG: gas vesicle protein [Pseudanabaena sp. ELA607]|jgi:hypothetical protein